MTEKTWDRVHNRPADIFTPPEDRVLPPVHLDAWTDERIREAFIYDGGESAYHDPINGERDQRRIAGAIFDAWLVAHDAALLQAANSGADELEQWAIRWDDEAPGYPRYSQPKPSREEAALALAGSVFTGRIVKRTVRTTEWVDD